jgi:hypothetical protein
MLSQMTYHCCVLYCKIDSHYTAIYFRFYDESIRWLIANNKIKKTEQVLKKAARMNNVDFEKVIQNVKFTSTAKNNMDCDRDAKTTVQRYNAMTILKNKPILHCSIILWIAWYVQCLGKTNITTSEHFQDRRNRALTYR